MPLPDPSERPLLRVDELVGLIPGMSRSAAYNAVGRGELPSVRVGRRIYVPNAALRDRLQLPAAGQLAVAP